MEQKEALDDKDKPTVKKVIKGLKKAVATHQGQVKSLSKDIEDQKQYEALDNKDKPTVKKVIKGLKKAVATHQGQVKSLSKDIEDQKQYKESTIREKLLAVLESDRASHYKSATEPEEMDSKMSPGGKKMKADIQGNTTDMDMLKKAFDDVSKAGRAGPAMKPRTNDKKDGDKKMMTPPEDVTKKAGMKEETRDQLAGIKAAYASMGEK